MESDISDVMTCVRAAAVRPDVRNAVAGVYADLDARIAIRRPLCVSSGRCCHFDEFGHRLYVTTMELARFVFDLAETRNAKSTDDEIVVPGRNEFRRLLPILPKSEKQSAGGCAFQIGNLCGVHAIRPFGCRIYFCDASSTQFQHDLYAEMHGRLRLLHDSFQVPYFYIEWRNALKMMALQPSGDSDR